MCVYQIARDGKQSGKLPTISEERDAAEALLLPPPNQATLLSNTKRAPNDSTISLAFPSVDRSNAIFTSLVLIKAASATFDQAASLFIVNFYEKSAFVKSHLCFRSEGDKAGTPRVHVGTIFTL